MEEKRRIALRERDSMLESQKNDIYAYEREAEELEAEDDDHKLADGRSVGKPKAGAKIGKTHNKRQKQSQRPKYPSRRK